jgi:hypothetical protein
VTREWESAVRRGALGVIERLAAAGADIDARDSHGQTALMIAAHEGQGDLVRWLVARGAGLDRTAKFGLSALMLAVVRGDAEIVQTLVDAGADLALKGTGAPGFDGKTALDLAMTLGAMRIVGILHGRGAPYSRLTSTPYFTAVATWSDAERLLTFVPLQPHDTAGFQLESLRIHVRDHSERALPIGDRTLEAHYGGFVLSQARRGGAEARRLALDVSYGPAPRDARIRRHEARIYELGPEVPPDDIDGRSPAVVTWHDGDMFFMVASGRLTADVLMRVALSIAPRVSM